MRRFLFLALVLGLVSPASAQVVYGPGVRGGYGPQPSGTGSAGTFTISNIMLSTLIFNSGTAYSATASATLGGAGTMSGQPTMSLSTTATNCNTTNGANNGSFSFSGFTLSGPSSGGPYSICVASAVPGATNTPLGKAFTITGVVPAYAGQGDATSLWAHWYGLRAYSQAIATAGTHTIVQLRNTAGTPATCDFLPGASGGIGVTSSGCSSGGGQSLATFCTTSCFVVTLYDQVGSLNMSQATSGSQPALTLNCINTSLPCMTFSGGQSLSAASGMSSTQAFLTEAVVQRTGGGASDNLLFSNTSAVYTYFASSGVQWDMYGGNGAQIAGTGMTSGTWYVLQGYFYGAYSLAWTSAGTTNPVPSSGYLSVGALTFSTDLSFGGGSNPFTGNAVEWGFADNLGSSGSPQDWAPKTAVCHNSYLWWGQGCP